MSDKPRARVIVYTWRGVPEFAVVSPELTARFDIGVYLIDDDEGCLDENGLPFVIDLSVLNDLSAPAVVALVERRIKEWATQ